MDTHAKTRRLVAGNWKMNLNYADGMQLAKACATKFAGTGNPVVLCTPAIHLHDAAQAATGRLRVGAQDISAHASGAHTGELSGEQLSSVGCAYTLVGHSERRTDHREKGELLAQKVDQALANNLTPIYCFGETLEQRDADQQEAIVAEQLTEGLSQLDEAKMSKVVLAYEPVWAIGTGRTASPSQAQAVHAHVRKWVAARFGESCANTTTILYGGSVKPGNAKELFSQTDIDGGLIGGASLKIDDFAAIVAASDSL